jgi:gluconate 2-dehydrogenase gamma chain
MTNDALPRRRFLLGAGLGGTAIAAGISELAEAQPQPAVPPPPAAAPPAPDTEPFITLTASEAAFIVAAVDTLIPADELSPSGSDCGVAIFIDRQLGSAWGGGAKMYRSGPFHKGKPEQGYQLALTPREFFAAGIAATNAWSRKDFGGKDLDRLAANDRVILIKRYARSRLYCPRPGRYVSVGELRKWQTNGVSFRVVDTETGADVTRVLMA